MTADELAPARAGVASSYETVTLVELRSIGFRLCDECCKTLWEQLAPRSCSSCGEPISCPCGVGIGT